MIFFMPGKGGDPYWRDYVKLFFAVTWPIILALIIVLIIYS